ncbi:MAG: 2-oxoacid:acceptor oxidoreductase subunit alpha [Fimbriimonadaceae bacterium]|nr:2-oxoacid:acceptor oxidoreductase subunit alpha [Chthonomonadaceae bacterium]MCO5296243.1 2-oxoacid:acceptor oxidoreductase subunit alpha [Fimbriimonadaceae bacterium]
MKSRINDFAFKIATVNGTGSASANALIMQTIFRMGIPVTGKNLFPSNIQGLPTWYEFRVSKDGYTARTPDFDLMGAFNKATFDDDVAELRSGGYLLYDSTWPLDESKLRNDVVYLGIPFARLCNEAFGGVRERILMKNIAYAGALAALLNLDPEILSELAKEKFGRKPALLESNQRAIELGFNGAKERFACPLPIALEPMDETKDCILIDGNAAAALGCLYAGATVGAWYPITPATSLMESFNGFCQRYRKDPVTQKNRFAILQAEDELAAIGIVIGASWAGARSFTPTAGPGISLMSEFLGLAYYAEVPAVVFDVQRTGPSTGMPTRTQQGDLMLCAYASHGDTKHICLYPSDPREAFEMAVAAFDLAERYQTPVMVLTDLDIGMNDWMVPKLKWDDTYRPDRGKVLSPEQLDAIAKFSRYLDVDGDGIPYRTLPGQHPKGAYFTRGSGHNKHGLYTEDGDEYQEVLDRLATKIQGAAKAVPAPVMAKQDGAKMGIVTVGGCHAACVEARDQLAAEGIASDYMRVRGFPFGDEVREFLEAHETNFVVEQNRDGQLRSLLALETGVCCERLDSVRYYAGYPMSAHHVVEGIKSQIRRTA